MTNESFPSNTGALQPGRGALVLTLGSLSLVLCALLGPIAWLIGKGDLEKMGSGLMDSRDRGITKAGMICGIVGTVILALGLVFGLLAVLGGGMAASVG